MFRNYELHVSRERSGLVLSHKKELIAEERDRNEE